MELVSGATLDQLTLVECLAEGGTSSVWSAEHAGLGRRVAVKFLSHEFAEADPAWRERVSREASIAARIGTKSVVEIFGTGAAPDGAPYIVMELLEGIDVARAVIATGALTLHEVATILEQVADVLDRAHELGIVHRDIKPDNLFLLDSGELSVKVLDFGIAKLTYDLSSSARPEQRAITVTKGGMILGTPEFMSPEQSISPKDVDFRSDLFSLGMVAYYALTGDLPFPTGDSPTLWRRAEHGPIPLRRKRTDLPDALDPWFRKALALQPTDRYTSAKEMADTFLAVAKPFLPEAPPISRFHGLDSELVKAAPSAPLPAAGMPSSSPVTSTNAVSTTGTPPTRPSFSADERAPESLDPTHPSYVVPGYASSVVELAGSPSGPVLVARRPSQPHAVAHAAARSPSATPREAPQTVTEPERPVPFGLWLVLLVTTLGAAVTLVLR